MIVFYKKKVSDETGESSIEFEISEVETVDMQLLDRLMSMQTIAGQVALKHPETIARGVCDPRINRDMLKNP